MPVASMAVLADNQAGWKPSFYEFEILGCKHRLDFPIAKLTDYHDNLDALQTAENPFAIITACHILTQQTKRNDNARFQAKRLLIRSLYSRKWAKQKIIDLFKIIDWMMILPEHLAQQIQQEIVTIEELEKMQYVTSIERMAQAKGREEGREEGREQGREQGIEIGALDADRKTLQRLLVYRFKNMPDWVMERILNASAAELELWLLNILDATTIEQVFSNQNVAH